MIEASRMAWAGERVADLRAAMAKVLVGLDGLTYRLLVGLLCRGHILIEGVPGLAKTLAVRTLAGAVRAEFKRVQFTPDLLPADILGTEIYEAATGRFTVRKGPVFAHIVLADEINRAPSKVQSALLEAMAERRVTIGGQPLPLPEPFMVLATQNPSNRKAPIPCPKPRWTGFFCNCVWAIPTPRRKRNRPPFPASGRRGGDAGAFGRGHPGTDDPGRPGPSGRTAARLHRGHGRGQPRAWPGRPAAVGRPGGLWRLAPGDHRLAQASRAWALVSGRDFVTPGDIKTLAPDVLRHRVLLTYEALAEGLTPEAVVTAILDAVPVP
jgi:MoxR-like ATPase